MGFSASRIGKCWYVCYFYSDVVKSLLSGQKNGTFSQFEVFLSVYLHILPQMSKFYALNLPQTGAYPLVGLTTFYPKLCSYS